LRETVLSEKRFILAHGFRSFSLWSAGAIAFRPVARQKPDDRRAWHRKAAHLMASRKLRVRPTGRDQGKTYPSDLHSPSRHPPQHKPFNMNSSVD
jgi:hypothetical protein